MKHWKFFSLKSGDKKWQSQSYKAWLDRISKCRRVTDLGFWNELTEQFTSTILNKQPITHVIHRGMMNDGLNNMQSRTWGSLAKDRSQDVRKSLCSTKTGTNVFHFQLGTMHIHVFFINGKSVPTLYSSKIWFYVWIRKTWRRPFQS